MRVLWITNQPIGAAAAKLSFKATSGTWMEPIFDELSVDSRVELSVACLASVKEYTSFCEAGVGYHCVPRSKKKIYPYKSRACRKIWKQVVDTAKPDLIMIWGTEYAHGLCAQQVAPHIPSTIVIQGVLHSIHRYYLAGMTEKELRKAYTIRNFLKHDSIRQEQRLYGKKAAVEREMLNRSGNILCESQWAKATISSVAPKCKFYEYRLSVKDTFAAKEWTADKCNRYSLFCTAPVGYPLKGFHNMIKAMAIIHRECPEVVLRVPGINDPFCTRWLDRFKRTGYIRYLADLIEENGLKDHIQFLGRLSSEQMAQELVNANVYVMSSAIENHSISLWEAMMVGVPCVASYVGSVPETMTDGVTGRLYRFEEYGQMAYAVLELMNNPELATAMGRAARENRMQYLQAMTSAEDLIEVYEAILKN